VANHLLSLFAEKATLDDDKTTYSPSKVLQAKCINYILVLLLTINNFRLTLTQVVIDLGLKESTYVSLTRTSLEPHSTDDLMLFYRQSCRALQSDWLQDFSQAQ